MEENEKYSEGRLDNHDEHICCIYPYKFLLQLGWPYTGNMFVSNDYPLHDPLQLDRCNDSTKLCAVSCHTSE